MRNLNRILLVTLRIYAIYLAIRTKDLFNIFELNFVIYYDVLFRWYDSREIIISFNLFLVNLHYSALLN